jgi:hypothetical protein
LQIVTIFHQESIIYNIKDMERKWKKMELNKILKNHKIWLETNAGEKADLYKENLCGAQLKEVDLRKADLQKVCLQEAKLFKAILREADLRDANLTQADLNAADLERANMQRARLIDADVGYANLRYALLQNAVLTGADLRWADLRGANLQNANLVGANLEGANLKGANLEGARLIGANLQASCLPLCSGGLGWEIDKEIWVQLAYHLASMKCIKNIGADEDIIYYEIQKVKKALIELGNKFEKTVETLKKCDYY